MFSLILNLLKKFQLNRLPKSVINELITKLSFNEGSQK